MKTLVDGIAERWDVSARIMDVSRRCHLSPHLLIIPSPPNLGLASALLINAHYRIVSELVQLSNNT